MRRRARRWGFIIVMMITASWSGTRAEAAELRPGRWTLGVGVGFLGNTPDDTALAVNAHADMPVAPSLTLGPLLQLGFTGDLSQLGLSGQAKYWIDLGGQLEVTVQGGMGFVHTDFADVDLSWLIPLGVGVDYALSDTLSATWTFLLNFTDLDTGRRDADVMPAVIFGLRF
jgi:hypothetical protein